MQIPLAEHGVDVAMLCRQCGISMEVLDHPHSQIPLSRYLNFLNTALKETNDPLLGIKLGKAIGVELLGALGFLFLVSRTLFDSLSSLSTYQNLLQGSTNMMLIRAKEMYFLTYEIYGMTQFDVHHDVEFSLAYTTQQIKTYTANKVKPTAISFRHSPSATISKYEQLLGIPCYFNQEVNKLHLSAEDITFQGDSFDPNLNQILRDYMDSDLDAKRRLNSFTDQVRSTILGIQPDQNITGDVIADKLGLSQSTFYRRLKEEGVTFKTIFSGIQYDLACQYLQESRLNIYQISHILGFSSAASFTRAFLKWSKGVTPRDYRKKERNTKA